MSFTKPEVQNLLHLRQRRTEPAPKVTCTKFGEIWACGFWDMRTDKTDRRTDRQTYRHADCNTSHPYPGEV